MDAEARLGVIEARLERIEGLARRAEEQALAAARAFEGVCSLAETLRVAMERSADRVAEQATVWREKSEAALETARLLETVPGKAQALHRPVDYLAGILGPLVATVEGIDQQLRAIFAGLQQAQQSVQTRQRTTEFLRNG